MTNDDEDIVKEIMEGLQVLSPRQLFIVARMVRHLHVPVTYIPTGASGVVDERFAEEMSNLLSLHHSTHESPLSKKPFEYVIKQCLIAQGHAEADLNPKPGAFTYDVFWNNERWSLKTEAAQRISKRQVKIEKLSEALWIREAETPEQCATEVRERLSRHMAGYDKILILRAQTRPEDFVYTLEEVPKELLRQVIASAQPSMFAKTARGTKEGISFGADFKHPVNGDKLFRMLLDNRVEKVRIWFQLKYCIHHGTWIVRRPGSSAQLFTSVQADAE